jgi:IS5 family transposase
MECSPLSPAKYTYRLRNWKAYNQSLKQRGSITLWIEDSVWRSWRDIPAGKQVGEKLYPDCVILCCLTLGSIYRQPLRQTQGFVESLLSLLGFAYPVPDYTTLCRRRGVLPVEVSRRLESGEKLELAMDSTGLKVFGEGEWKVRQHGASKRRTWRKLHIGIDIRTQEIVLARLTENSKDDAAVARQALSGQSTRLKSFHGDGGYDDSELRKTLGAEVEQIIPPPKDAVVRRGTRKKPVPEHLLQRNQAVEQINKQGRKQWKQQSGYHLRSRNEVAMYRYKMAFGGGLSARKMETQTTEAYIKCRALNIMASKGMPNSYLYAEI